VGHLYPSISRATVPKFGAKMPWLITSFRHDLQKFVTVEKSREEATFPSRKLLVELLYALTNGKLLKNSSLKYKGSQITLLTLEKSVRVLRKAELL